jgi:hypothetical protein
MKEVAAFLLGEASLDGYWFGERHPISPFWWREHLRAALSAPATAPEQQKQLDLSVFRMSWDYELSAMRKDPSGPYVCFSDLAYMLPATAPEQPAPERKPMTDEEVIDLVRECGLDWHKGFMPLFDDDPTNRFAVLVRAVEASHDIKDAP